VRDGEWWHEARDGIAGAPPADRADEHPNDPNPGALPGVRVLFVVNVDWFFLSHRLPLALAARDLGADVWVAAADTGFGPEIEKAGLRFWPLPLSRKGKNPFKEALFFMRLLRLYLGLKPALIHHVTIKPVMYGSIAARLVRRAAVVNAISGFGHVLRDSGSRGPSRALVLRFYGIALRHPRSQRVRRSSSWRAGCSGTRELGSS